MGETNQARFHFERAAAWPLILRKPITIWAVFCWLEESWTKR